MLEFSPASIVTVEQSERAARLARSGKGDGDDDDSLENLSCCFSINPQIESVQRDAREIANNERVSCGATASRSSNEATKRRVKIKV